MKRFKYGMLLVLAVVFWVTAPCAAQTGDEQSISERREEAKERFLKGLDLADAGNCRAAIAEFEASLAIYRRPNTLFNIAKCQARLFRYDLAIAGFERFLVEAPADDPDRPKVRARMEALRELLGTIIVESNVEAEVWMNDRLVGEAPGEVLIPPGTHVIELRSEGWIPGKKEVRVVSQKTTSATFTLRKAENRVEITNIEEGGLHPAYFWTALGLTVAAGIAGAILGVRTLVLRDDALSERKELSGRTSLKSRQDEIDNAALVADVVFATTGALAIGTVVILLLTDWDDGDDEDDTDGDALTVSPWFSPNAAGLSVGGSL